MNLIDFIPPKRYTDNQQPEAIGILIKKINEMIAVINQLNINPTYRSDSQ